jgi:Cu+-exporting ATPase
VQRAQSSRANIQRLGDRVSSVFVPVVVAIALAAGCWWGFSVGAEKGFIIAASILIVACPCAMGLATPAAIMAGSNAAARRGILIRDGVALEKAGKVTAVLFDKTGTLTVGRPTVAKVWEAGQTGTGTLPPSKSEGRMKGEEVESATVETPALRLAAVLAKHSTHPLSQAVAKLAAGEMAFDNWREVRGSGVQGEVSGSGMVRLGSMKWLEQMGVDVNEAKAFLEEWSARGATVLWFVVGKKLAAAFAIEDALKPGAGGVVRRLKESGLRIFLVTGDGRATAANIARQVGIAEENVFAEVRPEQKSELVRKLQAQGERVAFVGDGINDAPALEQADLGLAVSRASDIAREAADIILLKSEIGAVPEALGLARATLRTVKQNLFWAFFYNAVSVPLATLGFMSPILCAAAMGASDILVIGNALRLSGWKAVE